MNYNASFMLATKFILSINPDLGETKITSPHTGCYQQKTQPNKNRCIIISLPSPKLTKLHLKRYKFSPNKFFGVSSSIPSSYSFVRGLHRPTDWVVVGVVSFVQHLPLELAEKKYEYDFPFRPGCYNRDPNTVG